MLWLGPFIPAGLSFTSALAGISDPSHKEGRLSRLEKLPENFSRGFESSRV
jgi:hypothetical protein